MRREKLLLQNAGTCWGEFVPTTVLPHSLWTYRYLVPRTRYLVGLGPRGHSRYSYYVDLQELLQVGPLLGTTYIGPYYSTWYCTCKEIQTSALSYIIT